MEEEQTRRLDHARLHALREGHDGGAHLVRAGALPDAAGRHRRAGGVDLLHGPQSPAASSRPKTSSRIPISVELPPGATLEETDRTTQQITELIKDHRRRGEHLRAGRLVAHGRPRHAPGERDRDPGEARPFAGAQAGPDRPAACRWSARCCPRSHSTRAASARRTTSRPRSSPSSSAIPDIRAFKLNDRGERDLSFSILSNNEDDLNEAVARLEAALRDEPLLADVALGRCPAPARSADHAPARGGGPAGHHHARRSPQVVRVATIGDVDAALAKVSIDDRLIPVRVQLDRGVARRSGAIWRR